MQVEAAGDKIVARRRARERPVIAIRLHQLAADGEPGQLFEEETPRAPTGERKLADQLLVSGLLARGGGNPGEQLAIGHTPRLEHALHFGGGFKMTLESGACTENTELP